MQNGVLQPFSGHRWIGRDGYRISNKLAIISSEKAIPAMAAARGVRSRSLGEVISVIFEAIVLPFGLLPA